MEDNDYVLAFDHFYTTNHIQIMKSLLPFIPAESLPMLPAIIKYMELKYTLSLIGSGKQPIPKDGISACSEVSTDASADAAGDTLEQIYNAVHRYLAPDEEKSFHQILSAMRTMKNMREMQQMMELLQSLNPDMDFSAGPEGLTGLGGLGNPSGMNFNGTDISEMMQLLNSMK
ncbi:MAG: hypothetical protein NC337_10165 [Roseburia sp.]|nr:hypothetical protein [Roseburia sp.]